MVFNWFFGLTFPIFLTNLCMPIPIAFFSSFPTWGSHNLFTKVRYITRWPIGRNIVYSSSPSCYLLYNSNTLYLCFPFVSGWYTYNKSRIKCGSYFFTITIGVFNIKVFNAANEMCNFLSIGVGSLYTSFWLSYSQFKFSYFGYISGIQIICWVICG